MVVILSGITGVGKSYFKRRIIEKLKFNNIIVVTTREKRRRERNGVDKHFVSDEQFSNMKKSGEISVPFEFLNNKYAYYTSDLVQETNGITELHYSTIEEFKKVAHNVVSIYIKPKNTEIAKRQLKKRKLPEEVEKGRLLEIQEQIMEFDKNEELKKKFDYIIYNDYTEKSIIKVVNLIKGLMNEENLCLKEG